mmetsp:Transcript_23945/g.35149  ORF Transcript_23945/g.35149 Transcript_23945/m.35149 type:complete len:330 (+) Transcript_23945:62-1051(+)|eukprot:CAMPEP_0185024422 /NCGR_PEP_ID=MMETSP1103-20130426/7478_1 /TAXON_ID=36769 /ORGANISM="Paraphysomonas bandaiensis, Strain Caron Lab Isolate" /LENGTH=329 /DNA_ID=CAMNT_0027557383 /DNA_START=62 /DNA_END=1051 /DNA_ORIENTATION=+
MGERIAFSTDGFSVVVCRHPNGKFLAVNECRGRGWWLPAGHVDAGQNFVQAAIRETEEEAGINIILKGVLAVEHSLMSSKSARMRVIFYAEPSDPNQAPKSIPDEESLGAEWLTLSELKEKETKRVPQGLRGKELLKWGTYVANGGFIAPISVAENGHYDGFFRIENDGPNEAVWSVFRPVSDVVTIATTQPTNVSETDDARTLRKKLLQEGVNANAVLSHKQWTALHYAVEQSSIEKVRMLLLAGADPNAPTHNLRTPLHFAAIRGNITIIRMLCIAGAKPDVADSNGMTPAVYMQRKLQEDADTLSEDVRRGYAQIMSLFPDGNLLV